ncbi:zeta toxin family protein [Pedobacter alpinus]|uniref:Zeta toxin family protein n=1 Tax=Pedobacter alpinus TaxID=1590643 RepID=A0ABW5TQD0_9SPHI
MPKLFIITGSNGAGKSTVGFSYLNQYHGDIFDGDKEYLVKRSLLWRKGLRSEKQIKELASNYVDELLDSLVKNALDQKIDFAYEGHFSLESSWILPKIFKKAGYEVHFVFFGLTDIELSVQRVLIRAVEGGHYVDRITLTENFYGNLRKVDDHLNLFDSLEIVDTSLTIHKSLILFRNNAVKESINYADLPTWVILYLPNLVKLIKS